jgi:hypothetical protein
MVGISTPCPLCGRASEILPGEYEVVGDQLKLLLDPSISADALLKLRTIAERLQRSEISLAEAKENAEAIAPKAGKLFDIGDWSDQAKATLYAAILGAIALVAAARASAPATVVNVTNRPVIERVVPPDARQKKTPLPGLPGGPPLKT